MEVGTHSPWVSRLLKYRGFRVIVANPRQVRLISESQHKTDHFDARMLPRLGRADLKLLSPVEHRGEQAQTPPPRPCAARRSDRRPCPVCRSPSRARGRTPAGQATPGRGRSSGPIARAPRRRPRPAMRRRARCSRSGTSPASPLPRPVRTAPAPRSTRAPRAGTPRSAPPGSAPAAGRTARPAQSHRPSTSASSTGGPTSPRTSRAQGPCVGSGAGSSCATPSGRCATRWVGRVLGSRPEPAMPVHFRPSTHASWMRSIVLVRHTCSGP